MLNFLQKHFGYRVYGFGYSKEHRTFTRREALAWVACYDDGALVIRRHKVVMVRHGLFA